MSWPDLLAQVKVELSKTTDSDDDALRSKIDAACAEIEKRVGHVAPQPVIETIEVGCDGHAILRETPVMVVTGVTVLDSVGAVVRDLGAGTVDDSSGVLYGLPTGTVQISYVAGRDPIPADFLEAAVQLAAHLWRMSRSLDGAGRVRAETVMGPGMSSAMPNKVKDLLGLTGKANRSRVYVG